MIHELYIEDESDIGSWVTTIYENDIISYIKDKSWRFQICVLA